MIYLLHSINVEYRRTIKVINMGEMEWLSVIILSWWWRGNITYEIINLYRLFRSMVTKYEVHNGSQSFGWCYVNSVTDYNKNVYWILVQSYVFQKLFVIEINAFIIISYTNSLYNFNKNGPSKNFICVRKSFLISRLDTKRLSSYAKMIYRVSLEVIIIHQNYRNT